MDERTMRVLEYNKIVAMLKDMTVSVTGRELAEQLRPANDRLAIIRLLDETSEAEYVLHACGACPLGHFPDIRSTLRRAEIGAMLSIAELLDVGRVLSVCRKIINEINSKKLTGNLNIMTNILHAIKLHDSLSKEIERCIESEERISSNASAALANIRRHMIRSTEKVKDRLHSIISSVQFQKYLQEPIVTIRNGRYVVPVKQEYRANVSGLIHDHSSSGATVFIEPMSVVEANNELREWKSKEEHETERILRELSMKVAEVYESLMANIENLSKLDLYFAKAKLSKMMSGVRPKLNEGQNFNIVSGRHPLIDADKVVPINIRLGHEFNILIITGPNTGGKTVTLKTVGLFILMTQSGLYIPAGIDTEIGYYERIYADIGDEQSIEQNLSTFSSHMSNLVPMINDADANTLLLFDELGAGTDPVEGAALAMAILDHLKALKTSVIATTHYSELKAFALLRSGMENASTEFDVETLRPTYRLFIGIPGRSNAFEISRRLGLSENLINMAKNYISRDNLHFDDIIKNIEQNRLLAQQERELTRSELEEAKKLRLQFEKKEFQLEEKKESILNKARDEAKEIISSAHQKSEELIQEINQIKLEEETSKRNKIIEETRKKFKQSLKNAADKQSDIKVRQYIIPSVSDLTPGQTVYITSLNQYGHIIEFAAGNDEAVVQVGIMKINVSTSDLRIAQASDIKVVMPKKRIIVNERLVTGEISVRGQRLEEAIMNVDKYLDDALISGLNEVTIIHGKGQGILRNGIHDLLRNHPHIESFRLGKYGEGEWGVTIASLRAR